MIRELSDNSDNVINWGLRLILGLFFFGAIFSEQLMTHKNSYIKEVEYGCFTGVD